MARERTPDTLDTAGTFYQGSSGADYHDHRAGSRSDADQRSRAVYFEGLSTAADIVLDFGCGTGGVVACLPAARRIGVEINEKAAAVARERLDTVHRDLADVPAASVDRIMSFHALEHVEAPIATFRDLASKLKPGGRARLIVPMDNVFLEAAQRRWKPNDTEMHLYAWTPLTFGNSLATAGFVVEDVRIVPFSGGGKLARLFRAVPPAARLATWAKALAAGRLQLAADVHRPGSA